MQTLMQEVAINKLNKLAENAFFDICTLTSLVEMLGGKLTTEENKLLGYVHCMHYDKMSRVARAELALYIRDILGRYIKDVKIPEFTALLLTK